MRGASALIIELKSTPIRDSLYTFSDLASELGSGLPSIARLGFPEFTSLFDPNYFGKLRNATGSCSTIELHRNVLLKDSKH